MLTGNFFHLNTLYLKHVVSSMKSGVHMSDFCTLNPGPVSDRNPGN